MPVTNRNYRGKDVEMLIATSTIVETAITNKDFLITKRATWQDPFFDDLKSSIDKCIKSNLGIDTAKLLRQSTQAITKVQAQAIKDLAEFKVQFTEDFKKDKPRRAEILNQLGFTTYHRSAQTGDQEALINLLYQFKKNMTPALTTEISTQGTDVTLITNITTYADTLKNANITQETFKGSKKSATAAALKEFNGIYDTVISIAKIASNFYKEQPELKSQFSYAKVVKALNQTPKPPKPPTTPK
jgi:hypothetical protein